MNAQGDVREARVDAISSDERRLRRAWAAVMTVRSSAQQLEPAVAGAIDAIVDMYAEDELARAPSLERALTVMVGTLTAMKSAREILGWLEPAPSPAPGVSLQ
jgi:hypothetical protein